MVCGRYVGIGRFPQLVESGDNGGGVVVVAAVVDGQPERVMLTGVSGGCCI